MSNSARNAVVCVGLFLCCLAAHRTEAQVLAKTLLFNTVQPCRVADTRSAAAGILIGGSPRTFNVVGPTTNYTSQGGVAGGCGIPGFAGGLPQVQAVAVNIVAVSPTGDGFLKAWPSDQSSPLASTVNFQHLVPNLNIANGVIVPVRQDVTGSDITIVAGGANAHVVIDVVGYFSKAEPRKYYLTVGTHTGGNALTACASGFHMASLWEILAPSTLSYNSALGFHWAHDDQGSGPPAGADGWVRTGRTDAGAQGVGAGNCSGWIAGFSTDYGTAAELDINWTDPATLVSPWRGKSLLCSVPQSVWCVED